MEYTDDEHEITVTRVRTPPMVVEGFDLVVPDSPIGEVGVVVDARMIPVEIIPISFPATTTTVELVTGTGLYCGHSIRETAGGAGADLDILDGQDADGISVTPITLVANESTRDWYPLPGITIHRGLFVVVHNGTVRGTVYYGVPRHLRPERRD